MPAPQLAALTAGEDDRDHQWRFLLALLPLCFLLSSLEAMERLSGVFAAVELRREAAGVEFAVEGQRIMSWETPLLRAARKWMRSPTSIFVVL